MIVCNSGPLIALGGIDRLIAQVEPLVSAIREFGYWLSDKIVAEILRQAGE